MTEGPGSTGELCSPSSIWKDGQVLVRGVTHPLHFTKSPAFEHLLLSAHKATPNKYKVSLSYCSRQSKFWGKTRCNNTWCYFKLLFSSETYTPAFYNPWQQVIIPSHNKTKPMTPKGRTSILLVSLTMVNKF